MSLGKRTIYVATPTLGFEVDGYPQELRPRQLVNGIFSCNEEVEYISITEEDNTLFMPTKAICLLNKYYVFHPHKLILEEEDIVDYGVEVIQAKAANIIRFDKGTYVRKYKFDCSIIEDEQSSPYQPISGLGVNATYLTIKTQNFAEAKDKPKSEDILFYNGAFWIIEDTRAKYTYLPRKKTTLFLSLKQIKI